LTASPIIPLLISHAIGDVAISSKRLAVLKRDAKVGRQLAGIAIHCGFHAVASYIMLQLFGCAALLGAALVFGQHFIIDFVRCRIERLVWGPGKPFQTISGLVSKQDRAIKRDKKGFLIWGGILGTDQLAHLFCLLGISTLL
jgi:hypothetical protein